MKKTKTLYWVFTGLFAASMGFTAIPDVMMLPDAVTFVTALGYPKYFVMFIGIAKMLGSIAILIPGFPRIKEWAYAGLFFDLFAAVYSQLATTAFDPKMLFMSVFFILFALSYVYYHKLLREKGTA